MSRDNPMAPFSVACPTVPFLNLGTTGQSTKNQDSLRDKNGTSSLKLLAYKILNRDKTQDKDGTTQKKMWDKPPQKKAVLSHLVPPFFDGEKSVPLVPVVDEASPIFRETVLMLGHNGKPESCIHCGRWQNLKERPWWVGVCDISGEGKTNKSHCNIPSYEEILQ